VSFTNAAAWWIDHVVCFPGEHSVYTFILWFPVSVLALVVGLPLAVLSLVEMCKD